jgi:fructose-1,6-bisphosphatase I
MSTSNAASGGANGQPHQARRGVVTDNLTSLQTFILEEESRFPNASGEFSWIVSAISLAAKMIAYKVRHVRLQGGVGKDGEMNVQGEEQIKMDVIANEVIMRVLGSRSSIAVLGSEEDEQPTILRKGSDGGKYGSSTVFVITTGHGVHMFELDMSVGSFLLVQRDLKMPKRNKVYSVNEAYSAGFPEGYQCYLRWAHEQGYSSRYIGSMVADIHRTLVNGGVFLYPPTKKHPDGKLRLLYEANPMSFLVEQAGGTSSTGTSRTMELMPTELHARTPLVMGSADEVEHVMRHLRG